MKPSLFNEGSPKSKVKVSSFNEEASKQKVRPSLFNEGSPEEKAVHYHLMKACQNKK